MVACVFAHYFIAKTRVLRLDRNAWLHLWKVNRGWHWLIGGWRLLRRSVIRRWLLRRSIIRWWLHWILGWRKRYVSIMSSAGWHAWRRLVIVLGWQDRRRIVLRSC
jgi:hypothetical protein